MCLAWRFCLLVYFDLSPRGTETSHRPSDRFWSQLEHHVTLQSGVILTLGPLIWSMILMRRINVDADKDRNSTTAAHCPWLPSILCTYVDMVADPLDSFGFFGDAFGFGLLFGAFHLAA